MVVEGAIGMYWLGHHIAVEELLAVATTMVTMNISINPDLWTDPKRRIELPNQARPGVLRIRTVGRLACEVAGRRLGPTRRNARPRLSPGRRHYPTTRARRTKK